MRAFPERAPALEAARKTFAFQTLGEYSRVSGSPRAGAREGTLLEPHRHHNRERILIVGGPDFGRCIAVAQTQRDLLRAEG